MKQKEQTTGRFGDLGIGKKFLAILSQKGFAVPTPIQRQVIPGALDGKDVVGIAQTGTGKTLAFGIPMIQRLAHSGGQGLIVVPTRELAIQVQQALGNISHSFGMRLAVVIGGTSQHPQVRALKNNPHIVIATPGRLVDLMKQGSYTPNKVNMVVLDEADRMLDVGFLPEIKRILQTTPERRQTMLFSATMPKSISSLASAFMRMPIRIEIDPQGTPAKNTDQELFVIRKNDKMRLLDSILLKYKDERTLIFSRTKFGAKRIARDIRNMGYTATEIHSNRSQAQRRVALEGFTKGRFRIMVATDIAARGIDVKDISLVINFDLPDNSEDYVHRIGRTGRAGRHGKAISFVAPSQKADVLKIERLIRKSLPVLSLPHLPPERQRKSEMQKQFLKEEPENRQRRHYSRGSSGKNSYQKRRRRSSDNRGESSQQRYKKRSPGGKPSVHRKRRYGR